MKPDPRAPETFKYRFAKPPFKGRPLNSVGIGWKVVDEHRVRFRNGSYAEYYIEPEWPSGGTVEAKPYLVGEHVCDLPVPKEAFAKQREMQGFGHVHIEEFLNTRVARGMITQQEAAEIRKELGIGRPIPWRVRLRQLWKHIFS